jgi:ABC-type glycerol-3-phosphate transport system substrate-binding protein
MRAWTSLAVLSTLALAACGAPAGSLQAAADTLGATEVTSITFSGTGQ